jgi:hypothetical protein
MRLLATPKVHFSVRVDLGVAHSLTALHEEDFYLGLLPSEHGEVNSANGGKEFFASGAIVHTNQTHNSGGEQLNKLLYRV